MSRTSRQFSVASVTLFLLAPAAGRFGDWYDALLNPIRISQKLKSQTDAAGSNEWNIAANLTMIAALFCAGYAIFYPKDRTDMTQRLFPE
jgi:hypothetical protein